MDLMRDTILLLFFKKKKTFFEFMMYMVNLYLVYLYSAYDLIDLLRKTLTHTKLDFLKKEKKKVVERRRFTGKKW